MNIIELINRYGFPIVAACGMGYMIYYVWDWATRKVKPLLSETDKDLIKLMDRIRMLDNDLIRLNQKIDVAMKLRGKTIELERQEADEYINKK